MPWTLELAEQGQVLLLTYRGLLSPAESAGMTRQTLERILETGVMRVMLDCSAAQMEIPVTDIYKLPDRYEAAGVPRAIRVAVLVPHDNYKRELFEFYEDVCRNRGYFVRLFEDAVAAWDWLRAEG
ncbi:MAG TPA: hypothetical protein VF651_09130 [Gammaproteobacteria bacterium]